MLFMSGWWELLYLITEFFFFFFFMKRGDITCENGLWYILAMWGKWRNFKLVFVERRRMGWAEVQVSPGTCALCLADVTVEERPLPVVWLVETSASGGQWTWGRALGLSRSGVVTGTWRGIEGWQGVGRWQGHSCADRSTEWGGRDRGREEWVWRRGGARVPELLMKWGEQCSGGAGQADCSKERRF